MKVKAEQCMCVCVSGQTGIASRVAVCGCETCWLVLVLLAQNSRCVKSCIRVSSIKEPIFESGQARSRYETKAELYLCICPLSSIVRMGKSLSIVAHFNYISSRLGLLPTSECSFGSAAKKSHCSHFALAAELSSALSVSASPPFASISARHRRSEDQHQAIQSQIILAAALPPTSSSLRSNLNLQAASRCCASFPAKLSGEPNRLIDLDSCPSG